MKNKKKVFDIGKNCNNSSLFLMKIPANNRIMFRLFPFDFHFHDLNKFYVVKLVLFLDIYKDALEKVFEIAADLSR